MSSSETCSRCGQEVRWGWRNGQEGYLHREDVDHIAIFGHIQTDEERAEIERQLDEPRTRMVTRKRKGEEITTDVEVVYTTRQFDFDRMKKEAREAQEAEAPDDEEEGHDEIEPIEVYATPIDRTDARMPQGVKNHLNTLMRADWEVVKTTYSRGPYLGASGKSLGVSDVVRVISRGPVVDGAPLLAVASWRDSKSDWVWLIHKNMIETMGLKALKLKIEEAPRGED